MQFNCFLLFCSSKLQYVKNTLLTNWRIYESVSTADSIAASHNNNDNIFLWANIQQL